MNDKEYNHWKKTRDPRLDPKIRRRDLTIIDMGEVNGGMVVWYNSPWFDPMFKGDNGEDRFATQEEILLAQTNLASFNVKNPDEYRSLWGKCWDFLKRIYV